jgi:hypothetical protein
MVAALFRNFADAQKACQVLQDAGIRAEVHDEPALGKLWGGKQPLPFPRVEVAGEQFETAEQLLIDWTESVGSCCGAIRCPDCGSLSIDYPQHGRKTVIPNVVMGTLASIGGIEKQFYCNDCHFTWPREGAKVTAEHPNSAPNYFMENVPAPEAKAGSPAGTPSETSPKVV